MTQPPVPAKLFWGSKITSRALPGPALCKRVCAVWRDAAELQVIFSPHQKFGVGLFKSFCLASAFLAFLAALICLQRPWLTEERGMLGL